MLRLRGAIELLNSPLLLDSERNIIELLIKYSVVDSHNYHMNNNKTKNETIESVDSSNE